MKAYFLAGIALEEANDKRDRARARLREEALKHCPEAVTALDVASDGVKAAEAHLAHVLMAIMKGEGANMAAKAKEWAESHAQNCDDPNCEIKRAVRESHGAPSGGVAN
jgi:hypothetical protein